MTRYRRGIIAVVVAAGMVGLTSCGPSRADLIPHDAPSGGQTLSEARSAIARIPGLTVDFQGGERPNIKGNTGYDIAVTVDPGYWIVDGPALVTFLTESAWSVRNGYLPNARISLTVTDDPANGFDVAKAAAAAEWIEPRDPVPESEGFTVANVDTVEGSPARVRLGDWPGEVPDVPTGVTAAR